MSGLLEIFQKVSAPTALDGLILGADFDLPVIGLRLGYVVKAIRIYRSSHRLEFRS